MSKGLPRMVRTNTCQASRERLPQPFVLIGLVPWNQRIGCIEPFIRKYFPPLRFDYFVLFCRNRKTKRSSKGFLQRASADSWLKNPLDLSNIPFLGGHHSKSELSPSVRGILSFWFNLGRPQIVTKTSPMLHTAHACHIPMYQTPSHQE